MIRKMKVNSELLIPKFSIATRNILIIGEYPTMAEEG